MPGYQGSSTDHALKTEVEYQEAKAPSGLPVGMLELHSPGLHRRGMHGELNSILNQEVGRTPEKKSETGSTQTRVDK